LKITIQLPQLSAYKNFAVAYTGQFVEYNGTSVTIEVKDGDIEIEEFDGYYPTNRFRPFVHIANQWFSMNGPLSD